MVSLNAFCLNNPCSWKWFQNRLFLTAVHVCFFLRYYKKLEESGFRKGQQSVLTGICGSLCIFQLKYCNFVDSSQLWRLKWFGALLSLGCRAHYLSVIPPSVLQTSGSPSMSTPNSLSSRYRLSPGFPPWSRLLGAPTHENLLFLLDINEAFLCEGGEKYCLLSLDLAPFHVCYNFCMCRLFADCAGCVVDTAHTLGEL